MRFPLEHQTVVCVDDQPEILNAIRRTLAGEPSTVRTTDDPRRVFEWVEKGDVGLVITDQRMPERSGTELLENVYRRSPTTARIVLTAYASAVAGVRRIGQRTDCLVDKPWDGVMLRRLVRDLLRARWLGRLDEEIALHPERIGAGP
jgi:DNA-binding NtrC family response regulator